MERAGTMSRFVDYFVICGYDHTKGRPGGRESCSQVIQRFPEKDWPDIPFVHGLDRFCQVVQLEFTALP
jgi:hypothetical protein